MSLRLATFNDLEQCLNIGEEFWDQTEYNMPYNRAGVMDLLVGLIQSELFIVYEYENEIVGVAALLIAPFHFDPSIKVATELFWYVRPGVRENGVGEAMLDGMEAMAKTKGAHLFGMGTMYDPKADAMLESRGYKQTEKTFTKVL
jgi:GNAT superfamily N-acetyltransferase